jgi:hypothetical protein
MMAMDEYFRDAWIRACLKDGKTAEEILDEIAEEILDEIAEAVKREMEGKDAKAKDNKEGARG